MKKIAIVLLFVSFGSFTMAQKFAYVDTKYILSHIPAYESAQEQLDAISVGWQKEIEVLYSEIDKMYKDYQAEKVLLLAEPQQYYEKRDRLPLFFASQYSLLKQ